LKYAEIDYIKASVDNSCRVSERKEAVERLAETQHESDDGRVHSVRGDVDTGLRRHRVARHRIQLLSRSATNSHSLCWL